MLQKVWQSRIKELVEAWSGVELETTDIYGENSARIYSSVNAVAG